MFGKCPKGTIYNKSKKICDINNTEYSNLNRNDIITINLQKSITIRSFNNVIKDDINEGDDYTIEKTLYQIFPLINKKHIKIINFQQFIFEIAINFHENI